ncbi:hypothetical protein [Labedella phragmitis]|nr:hypothetical protein [Labedella phragmitis]
MVSAHARERIEGALRDVMLSRKPVRERAKSKIRQRVGSALEH